MQSRFFQPLCHLAFFSLGMLQPLEYDTSTSVRTSGQEKNPKTSSFLEPTVIVSEPIYFLVEMLRMVQNMVLERNWFHVSGKRASVTKLRF